MRESARLTIETPKLTRGWGARNRGLAMEHVKRMRSSARAFLAGLIDYAGLFPPAGLEMEPAARNYAAFRKGGDAWMLSRFICPASRLVELDVLADELFTGSAPWSFSVLPSAPGSEVLAASLPRDLETIGRFRDRHGDRVRPDLLEIRLSPASGDTPERLVSLIAEGPVPIASVFFEAAAGPAWRTRAAALIEQLAGREGAGFKMRCGGVIAEAYPDVDDVAFALTMCQRHGVAFKATAGLHHPLRHYREDLDIYEHGFLNLFGAGILLDTCGISEDETRRILSDSDVANFRFDETAFRYRGLVVSSEAITAARSRAVISFGSCSFDEPRADLRHLGIL